MKMPATGVVLKNLPCVDRRLSWIAVCASREFGREIIFSSEQRSEIQWRLGLIVGLNEQRADRPDVKTVINRLNSKSRSARKLASLSAVSKTGFVELSDADIKAIALLKLSLVQDPNIGTPEKADQFLINFSNRCATLAHASDIAAVRLRKLHGGQGGAPKLHWYDEFIKLVVEICECFGLRISLGYDRIEGTPSGQFYRLVEVMEKLLPMNLRSKTADTRYDRLEKSMKRIS